MNEYGHARGSCRTACILQEVGRTRISQQVSQLLGKTCVHIRMATVRWHGGMQAMKQLCETKIWKRGAPGWSCQSRFRRRL